MYIITKWNSSIKAPTIILSNNDLTATKVETNYGSFRSILGVNSGKWYWEITVDAIGVHKSIFIGIGDIDISLEPHHMAIDSDGYSYFACSGDKWNNGSGVDFGSSYGNTAIISIALDMDAGKLWWAKDGIWQANGNPGAGTNEAFSEIFGTFYAMCTLYDVDDVITANFGATSFSYTVPTGFIAGLGEWFEEGSIYTGKVYFHNTNLETRFNYPIKLILNENNFNFDLAQSNGFDFRLAERSNGSGVLKMWVAKWDKINKYAVLWFKIPYLSSDSKTTFYAFWGGAYSEDISTPEELTFLFYENFETAPLDCYKWFRTIDSNISTYGYLFPSDSSFTTLTNPLFGKNSWVVEAGVYLVRDDSCDLNDRAHGFEFIHKLFGFDITTWNPDDKHQYIYLSNGNLTVSCNSIGSKGARAKWYRNSGKWYWEVKVYNVYHVCIGIANTLWSLNDILGKYTYDGYGYRGSGGTWHYDITPGFDNFVTDDVIGIALDMDTGKIWWSRNGIWQAGGNPEMGIGARYSGISGAWYPAISLTSYYDEYATANFGTTDFSYPTPSGFVAWVEGDSTMTIEDDENDFIINIMHNTRIEHNAVYPDGEIYHNIDQTYGGLEQDSYQEHYIAYYEPEDRIYQRIVNRKSYVDIENKIDRKVEGDTRPNNVRLHGRQINSADDGAYPSYISWFVIREYDNLNLVNLDGSELYIPYEHIGHQIFDYKEYTDDLTSISYQHASSFGGNSYNLSNNIHSLDTDVWMSDINAISSDPIYVTIYFDRKENLVSRSRIHYDSGHEKFYNASKLSDSDINVYSRDHWRGTTTSGSATISFGDDRPIVNVFGIKMVATELNAGPKNYKIYGGWNYPDNFKLLHEGVFEKTIEWQSATFINKNPYKYYKFEIIDTYGNNIKVQEWVMYSYVEADKPKYISQLRLHPADFGGFEDNFPKQISLEGSNDMLNWETVMPWTNTYTPYIGHNISYGKWQRYSFTNIKGYWHYRLACKNNWGASNGRIIIGEWEMYELFEEANIHRILGGETNNIKQIWTSDSCGFEDEYGLVYIANEKLSIVQHFGLVEEKDISEFYNDINVVG